MTFDRMYAEQELSKSAHLHRSRESQTSVLVTTALSSLPFLEIQTSDHDTKRRPNRTIHLGPNEQHKPTAACVRPCDSKLLDSRRLTSRLLDWATLCQLPPRWQEASKQR